MAESRVMENEFLKVIIQDKGAEVLSIFHKNMKKKFCGMEMRNIGTAVPPFCFLMWDVIMIIIICTMEKGMRQSSMDLPEI